MTFFDMVREKLAKASVNTPNTVLNQMVKFSLQRQNKDPKGARELVERMKTATTGYDGKVEIRYTLLRISNVGSYLLSNTQEGNIRYLTKRKDGEEISETLAKIRMYDNSVRQGVPPAFEKPVLVKITMTKELFLGIYYGWVDCQTAYMHNEIKVEGKNWFFHSIVLLTVFDIFRNTLGLTPKEELEMGK